MSQSDIRVGHGEAAGGMLLGFIVREHGPTAELDDDTPNLLEVLLGFGDTDDDVTTLDVVSQEVTLLRLLFRVSDIEAALAQAKRGDLAPRR